MKHFSQWDYEFEYIYKVALDLKVNQLGLYMRVREGVVRGEFNKAKKELMSGITAELGRSSLMKSSGQLSAEPFSKIETKKT